ncbi:hypothetical protein INR49_025138 [Caranx melampygus]|nr:hypothetical protein INR49_025138 [Caranx melampygus]
MELSYPDNEILLTEDKSGFEEKSDTEGKEQDMPHLEIELEQNSEHKDYPLDQMNELETENELGKPTDLVSLSSLCEQTQEESQRQLCAKISEGPSSEPQAAVLAVEGDPELDGPPLELLDCPIELLHSYSLKSKKPDGEKLQPEESSAPDELNGDAEDEPQPTEETEVKNAEVKAKKTWKDRVLRTQQYAHLSYHCNFCRKDYKGLNTPEKQPGTEDTPAANGIADNVENQNKPQDENLTSISDEETPEQKPGSKLRVSSLKREDRIIRNLRTLIKKTSVLHKKCKNPDANIFKQVDFKDEQVVIQDGLVIIRHPCVVEKEEEEEGKENPVGENGYGVDIKYHLCPSESCDRVFLRISTTLTKHAIKCHINDEKVLEKTFIWAKHKCSLCLRQMQFLQQYKDHMKLHDTPLQYFCYHLECNERFLTHQELKDHVSTHQPFRPQCPFSDCEKLFSTLQGLYDHEWRHYIPAPQREELEVGPNRQKKQNAEAPWKQRVKVEELWLQNKKGQSEGLTPDQVEASYLQDHSDIKTEEQECEGNVADSSENHSEKTVSDEPPDVGKPNINGYEDKNELEGSNSSSNTGAAANTPSKKCRKRPQIEVDPLNVRDLEDLSTLAEGVQQKLGEPHITEHKTFKPEDPAYATFVKAPFIRPPPSTYLDESLLSMRKRRATDETAVKKSVYWNNKKKKETAPEQEQRVQDVAPEQKTRHRCDKLVHEEELQVK